MEIIVSFFLGFLSEGIGVALGILLLYLFNIKSKRMIGILFGGTAGIMIALICFDVLPDAFIMGQDLFVFLGVTIGVGIGLFLEQITTTVQKTLHIAEGQMVQTGIALLIGIAVHNIPEGFALGSIAAMSQDTVLNFAAIVCLHSIPEAVALTIPLKEAGAKTSFVMAIPFVLGGVMGIGAVGGYLFSQVSEAFVAVSLGLASGIILYIVCEELLPESKHIWNGRLTSVATVMGVLIGMLILR
ncbi:MAG: zinc permease [Epulopiscium sp. Nuni2H_MBin001]|nr:MAG: zinc permease [Epulopiscium sp. Nuni2H_MBin001]